MEGSITVRSSGAVGPDIAVLWAACPPIVRLAMGRGAGGLVVGLSPAAAAPAPVCIPGSPMPVLPGRGPRSGPVNAAGALLRVSSPLVVCILVHSVKPAYLSHVSTCEPKLTWEVEHGCVHEFRYQCPLELRQTAWTPR